MDVDPNYDPSDFLGGLKRDNIPIIPVTNNVQEDLAVSESDEEDVQPDIKQEILTSNSFSQEHVAVLPQHNEEPDDNDDALWF